MQRRLRFCQWFTQRAQNVRFMQNIVIGDGAAFHTDGTLSAQNVRCYASRGEPPRDFKFEKARREINCMCGLDCVAMGVSLDQISLTVT